MYKRTMYKFETATKTYYITSDDTTSLVWFYNKGLDKGYCKISRQDYNELLINIKGGKEHE